MKDYPMEILFYPERLHGLARTGALRCKVPVDVRVKTPYLMPRVHEAFMHFPEYMAFLKTFIHSGNPFLSLPAIPLSRKNVNILEQIGINSTALVFFHEVHDIDDLDHVNG
nr:hypothetical protein [Candidatus Sigynarchaeota archaeon]